jgi:hypothetical protein
MRLTKAVVMWSVAAIATLGLSVVLAAQAKTDEDYDKLMKGVNAANQAMRKAADNAGVAAESKKLEAFFKDAAAFWTGPQQQGSGRLGDVGDGPRRGHHQGSGRRERRRSRGSPETARRRLSGLPRQVPRED